MATARLSSSARKRGRPSEAARRAIDERVLDAAFAAFQTLGFDATRMDRVAASAEITKVSLYRRFPNKGHLLAEVIRRQAALSQPEVRALEPGDDPIDGIKTLMWTYRQRIGEDRMLAIQRLAVATLNSEDGVRDALADVRARYVAPVDMLVQAAKARGVLPPLPTEEIREILFDLLVNDAASLPLHGYPSAADQRRVFMNRWSVVERGLLITEQG